MRRQDFVRIVEVGLRDGLQNENHFPDQSTRKELLLQLIDAGAKNLEIGAFVSPKWVPAMACSVSLTENVLNDQRNHLIDQGIQFSVLVPNEKGMDKALQLGVQEVAIFASCSESFSQKNINCSINESFQKLSLVAKKAQAHKIKVRGYLSTCFGCPFEGVVDHSIVISNINRMLDLGVYEVSLGDTIGIASAGDVENLVSKILTSVKPQFLAGHFHDTRGQALANILKAFELGITSFDSSIGGLGGCPYAPGATGNVATEDVVYLFNSLGVKSGFNIEKLQQVNQWFSQKLGRKLSSRVSLAGNAFSKSRKSHEVI